MSSPSQSPNMIMNNQNNANMSEIPFVPSKVPTSFQQKLQQQQQTQKIQQQPASTPLPQPPSMLSNYSNLSSIPQSVPQLLTSSSYGSVSSQLTAQPLPSMPTMVSPQSSIPSSISAYSSVPNFPQPNMQHYQDQARFFASFLNASSLQQPQQQQLPSIPTQQQLQQQSFVNAPVSTNGVSSVPVANWSYNTSPINHSQPTYINYNNNNNLNNNNQQQQYPFNAYS